MSPVGRRDARDEVPERISVTVRKSDSDRDSESLTWRSLLWFSSGYSDFQRYYTVLTNRLTELELIVVVNLPRSGLNRATTELWNSKTVGHLKIAPAAFSRNPAQSTL